MGINTGLLNLIDERVKKTLSKLKILKYKHAVVQSVRDDMVVVKFEDNSIMELPNSNGNFVLPNTVVLVYYWGNVINKNTAYIGKNNTSVTVCNSSEYNAKENVLYFLKDTKQICIGDVIYNDNNESAMLVTLSESVLPSFAKSDGKDIELITFKNVQITDCHLLADLQIQCDTKEDIKIEYYIDGLKEYYDFTTTIYEGYSKLHLDYVFSNLAINNHVISIKIYSNEAHIDKGVCFLRGYNLLEIPAKPTTADDYVYLIQNNTVKLIYYKGTETRIQIPSEIEGKPVTTIESTCFTNSSVKYAVIPETVKNIY